MVLNPMVDNKKSPKITNPRSHLPPSPPEILRMETTKNVTISGFNSLFPHHISNPRGSTSLRHRRKSKEPKRRPCVTCTVSPFSDRLEVLSKNSGDGNVESFEIWNPRRVFFPWKIPWSSFHMGIKFFFFIHALVTWVFSWFFSKISTFHLNKP